MARVAAWLVLSQARGPAYSLRTSSAVTLHEATAKHEELEETKKDHVTRPRLRRLVGEIW